MIHSSAYQYIISFGKYKGNSLGYIADNDPNYLRWIEQTATMPPMWQEAARKTLLGEEINLPLPRVVHKQNKTPTLMVKVDDGTIAVRFPFSPELLSRFKSAIDGRMWNPQEQHWEFSHVHLPTAIKLFGGLNNVRCSAEVLTMLETELDRRKALDTIRVKTDTHLTINTTTPLYPFQRVGVEFVDRAGGRALIADQMGLGKSCEAIGFAVLKDCKTLIVCPKSVQVNWAREIKKFAGKESTTWTTQDRDGSLKNQFHIINYDAVAKRLSDLLKQSFDLLVCDEATFLKNRKTIRSKAVFGAGKDKQTYPGIKTKYVIFLTGTPILNRPIEAYTLLNVLSPERFDNWFHFTRRYGGWRGEEPRNLTELHDRTKDLIIRRQKKEVMPELPDKQRNDLYIEMEKSDKKKYEELLDELFKKWKFDGKPTVASMPAIQGFLAQLKLPRVMEMIDEYLEAGRSILIFSNYLAPLKLLTKHYKNDAALLTGEMSNKKRQESIDLLVAGKAKVGCISITAGGMGIDGLQHSIDTVVFLDYSWVPATMEQAEDRTHRTGQKNKVQVFYVMCENTIDEDMRSILMEKQKVIDQVMDGKLLNIARNKSYFREFVSKISKRWKDRLENCRDR